uniref:Aminotran_1_2 domain-containing protein n=1 Tax=Angiostrongylus cantonensis TaxID=6313 RepID=A0A0K0CWE8_ANGCA
LGFFSCYIFVKYASCFSDISNGQRGDAKPSVESEQTNAPVSDGPSLVSDDRERLQKLMQDQYQNMSITPAFSGVPLDVVIECRVDCIRNMDTLNKNLATNLRRMGYEDLLPIQTYSTSALLSG